MIVEKDKEIENIREIKSTVRHYGYIRVSSDTQSIDRQEELLKTKYGDILHQIYIDVCSGKSLERPQFNLLLNTLRPGDFVYVESFNRVSRSLIDLHKLIDFFKENKITLVSIKENFDYTTQAGKLLVGFIALLAQNERDLILERQKEGIALAKLKGKYKGRKPLKLPPNFNELMEKHLKATLLNPYRQKIVEKNWD